MPVLKNLVNTIRALRQLGFSPLLQYAGYQAKLRSGWFRRLPPAGGSNEAESAPHLQPIVKPANKKVHLKLLGKRTKQLYAEAEEILRGQVRLFGAAPRQLDPSPLRLQHWTRYHSRMPDRADIKPVWEAGRFGWATLLARGFWLGGKGRDAEWCWCS